MRPKSKTGREIARRRRRKALMVRRAVAVGILALFVIFVFGVIRLILHSGDKKQYTSVSHSVLVNGYPYDGRALLVSQGGEEYFPLGELAKAFEVEDCKLKHKSILWNGEEYAVEKEDVLSNMDWGGPSEDYIRVSSIQDILGLNVVMEDDAVCSIDNYPSLKYDWAASAPYIALEMGGVDKYAYTNSREAFTKNYKQGMRVFETTIQLTADNAPVAVQDWEMFRRMCQIESEEESGPMKEDDFLASRMYEKYTPMTCSDIFGLMVSNTDMYLVINADQPEASVTKKIYERILEEADRFDASIFDRIIPVVSSLENCETVLGLRDWDSVMFMVDETNGAVSTRDLVRHAMEKGIRLFAIDAKADDDYFIEQIHHMGGKVYLNACDDAKEAEAIRQTKGIDGFFTNFISPKESQ